MYDCLKELKTEIEHVQHLLERAEEACMCGHYFSIVCGSKYIQLPSGSKCDFCLSC